MNRWPQRLGRRHPLALAVLAALVLSFRLTGAGLLAPAIAGYVPICTGAEIVYLAVGDDGLPLDQAPPDSVACPFVGLVAALTPAGIDAPPPPEPLRAPHAIVAVARVIPGAPRIFDTRAPPAMA